MKKFFTILLLINFFSYILSDNSNHKNIPITSFQNSTYFITDKKNLEYIKNCTNLNIINSLNESEAIKKSLTVLSHFSLLLRRSIQEEEINSIDIFKFPLHFYNEKINLSELFRYKTKINLSNAFRLLNNLIYRANVWNAYISEIDEKDMYRANIANLQKGYEKYFISLGKKIITMPEKNLMSLTNNLDISNIGYIKSIMSF